MAHVPHCTIEGCIDPAATVCPQCQRTVCGTHSTLNDICFECVLGMTSGVEPEARGTAYIFWTT